jgi:hypothetical protein
MKTNKQTSRHANKPELELELEAPGDNTEVGDGLDLPVTLRLTLLTMGVIGSPFRLQSGSTIDIAPRRSTGTRN